MAGRGGAGIPAGHEDVEAGIVAVKHPSGGTHVGKRAEHHGHIVGAHGAPQLHGPFTVELAMHPSAQLPATVDATRHQVVLRPAQRSVSKETKECGHRQRGRITFDGAEVQSQHVAGIYLQRRLYPPPPPPRGLSCASLTLSGRPPKSRPFSDCMAFCASEFDISTKPKPRGWPVSRSLISATFSTVPCSANNARTVSSVAEKGRFPTYSFVMAKVPMGSGPAGYPAGQARECFEVADSGRECVSRRGSRDGQDERSLAGPQGTPIGSP